MLAIENGPPVQSRLLELPSEHALSWVHDLVDWEEVVDGARRWYDVQRMRMKLREEGVPHAKIVRTHKTGWGWFDRADFTEPSALGDAMRRFVYRRQTGADPPWHHPHVSERVRRRLTGTHTQGPLRRLSEAFLEGTLAAPFTFSDTVLPSGTFVEQSRVSLWEAVLRYLIGSTVGCYFTAPVEQASDTQGGDAPSEGEDGDKLKVLRPSKDKLCFPSWPILFPNIGTFRVITNTVGVDLYGLTYENWCTRDGVMQETARTIDSLGFNATSEDVLLPNALLLRSAEAVDSVLNAALSGQQATSTASAGYILCSIVNATTKPKSPQTLKSTKKPQSSNPHNPPKFYKVCARRSSSAALSTCCSAS